MSRNPWGGRPSKAALARIKVGTVVVSIAAFLGSLAGVAYLNPGMTSTAAAQIDAAQAAAASTTTIASVSTASSSAKQAAIQQQAPAFAAVRTRGS